MTTLLAIILTFAGDLARHFVDAVPLALPLALVAGIHAATWGAYKDAPYEGFHPFRQLRTLVIAGLAAVAAVMTGLVDAHTIIPAIGVVYAMERLATEWWKTIVRVDDQSAYTIPMRLGFRGRPIDVNWIRYAVGVLVLVSIVGFAVAMWVTEAAVEQTFSGLPWWMLIVTVGGFGGWATAFGGAWKDAPVEGFSFWKFLRSPAVATMWAVPLSLMTTNWLTLCLAAGGLSVFSIETYKTFWTGGRPPGKFANQPLRYRLPATRHMMGLMHTGAWLMLAAAALRDALNSMAPSLHLTQVGLLATAESPTWLQPLSAAHAASGAVSSTLIAGGALIAAIFVFRANVRLTASTVVSAVPAIPQNDDGPKIEVSRRGGRHQRCWSLRRRRVAEVMRPASGPTASTTARVA